MSRASFRWSVTRNLVAPRRQPTLYAARQALVAKDALGIVLIVRAPTLHRGDPFVVQVVGTGAAGDFQVPLVENELHFARHRLLGLANEGKQGVEFGCVPEAV